MVKNHSDRERGNQLPLHRLFFEAKIAELDIILLALPCQRKRPKRLEQGNAAAFTTDTAEQMYRIQFVTAIDSNNQPASLLCLTAPCQLPRTECFTVEWHNIKRRCYHTIIPRTDRKPQNRHRKDTGWYSRLWNLLWGVCFRKWRSCSVSSGLLCQLVWSRKVVQCPTPN